MDEKACRWVQGDMDEKACRWVQGDVGEKAGRCVQGDVGEKAGRWVQGDVGEKAGMWVQGDVGEKASMWVHETWVRRQVGGLRGRGGYRRHVHIAMTAGSRNNRVFERTLLVDQIFDEVLDLGNILLYRKAGQASKSHTSVSFMRRYDGVLAAAASRLSYAPVF